jgi:hypothetical protein
MDELTPVSPVQQKFFDLRTSLVQQPLQPVGVNTSPITIKGEPTNPVTALPEIVKPEPAVGVPVAAQPVQTTAPAVEVNPVGINIIDVLVRQAYDIILMPIPESASSVPTACITLRLLLATEIYADVHFIVTGNALKGSELNVDQVKHLFTSGELVIADSSTIDMCLSYKDDCSQVVAVTGICASGDMFVQRVHDYSELYSESLETVARTCQSNRLMQRFLLVLQKEATVVRNWLIGFPTSLL